MGKRDFSMRHSCCALFVLAVLLTGRAAWGQTPTVAAPPPDTVPPPAWLYNDLACASTVTTHAPGPLRVLGSQDPVIKHMMGPGDTLVVSGGSNAGLQTGQRFFVRRVLRTYGAMKGPDAQHPLSVHTAGWAQILGVDLDVSTATVVHACEGILLDDYLEPFIEPLIAAQAVPGRTPQYTNMGRILTSDEAFQTVATGQTINIDRGSDAGVVLGQRYLVFRDKRGMLNESHEYSMTFARNAKRLPLVEVGEVMVVGVGPDYSTVQVLISKDVITTGDFIAEIR
jgi:hypothetical protein